jgi:3-keto-disaccharide hydrolase
MKRFKNIFGTSAVFLTSFLIFTACQHTKPVASGDWRTLLDANHTNGWRMVGPGELKWENGELVTHGGMGLLVYEREKLGGCQIRVLFKLTGTNDNSGVFIRMASFPKDPWDAVNHGYEVQIHNGGDDWHRTGCLYSFTKAKNIVNARLDGWSTMLITLKGKRTIVEVDGKIVTDYTEGQPVPERLIWYEGERGARVERGYIGLQNHGGDAKVHFKNVSVAPLK